MNDDPSSVDVLYAKIQAGEQAEKSVPILNSLYDILICMVVNLSETYFFFFFSFLLLRLQILADRLVDRFSMTGLMQQEYSRVKLHITVMNTLMRRDPTSIPGERPPEGKRGNKERESFDAMNVMKVSLKECLYVLKEFNSQNKVYLTHLLMLSILTCKGMRDVKSCLDIYTCK